MATIQEIIDKLSNVNSAISDALEKEVAEAVKAELVKTARELVYDVYQPKFLSRRGGDGGILDPNSVEIKVVDTELIARDTLPGVAGKKGWQQLWGSGLAGGYIPSESLAEGIASGSRRFNMHNAGPRPFHEAAKDRLISTGILAEELRRGLERQGYDTSEMTLKFV